MATLEQAKSGHFEWEEARRPDAQKGAAPETKEHWVAVAVELANDFGGELDERKVRIWLEAIKALGDRIIIGAFDEARLWSEVSAKRWTARMTFLVARRVLDALSDAPPNSLKVSFLSIGEPFVPGEYTVPVIYVPLDFAAMKAKAEDQPVAPEAHEAPMNLPLVGIIDDGIAYLNRRFCTPSGTGFTTRFKAVWLQSESIAANGFAGDVPFGLALEEGDLNGLLAGGETDAEVYRRYNQVLYAPPSQQATNTRLAHGTHVLDLAAGEDPGTEGSPLIAVQLAPGTAMGTSGRRLEMFLVMGLRWMVHRAVAEKRDLVVNISLGSLAGPGDETNFVADAIAAEIAAFKALSGKDMRVVIAYGNSWRGDLVAELALKAGETRSVDWRILPDGYSSSYLELRVPRAAQGVTVEVIPPVGIEAVPEGAEPDLRWEFGTPKKSPVKSPADGALAQILPLPVERDAMAVLIAVAPTASLTPGDAGLAPPGAWKVAVTAGAANCRVTLRVQRNDTPTGYRVFGRQSWLADKGMGAWDGEMRDYTKPGTDSAIQREGTANAYAGLIDVRPPDVEGEDGPGIYYVGAVRPDAAQKGGGCVDGVCTGPTKAALYSSEGLGDKTPRIRDLNIKSKGPTLAAKGDDGRFFAGRLATHVTSGRQSQRLSGTSVSAGLVTRRVAAAFAAGVIGGPDELKAVLGDPPATGRDSRTGYGVVREDH